MKKGMIALSLALVVGLFSAFTYADSPEETQGVNMDYRSEKSQQFREDEFHERNGYLNNHCGDGFNRRKGMGRNHMGW